MFSILRVLMFLYLASGVYRLSITIWAGVSDCSMILSIYRLAESRDRFDDFLSFLWIYRFHFGRLWSVYVTIAQKDLLLPFRRRNIPSLW